jgi:hypothetical protein
LGFFKDDPYLLRSAIDYLNSHAPARRKINDEWSVSGKQRIRARALAAQKKRTAAFARGFRPEPVG